MAVADTEYEMCQDSKEQLKNPLNVLIIRRNKNKNVVIYQANLKSDGTLNESEPLICFWLKIEPSYIKKRRQQGYKDDRIGLNFLERNMGYGFSVEKSAADAWILYFVSLKSRPCVLTLKDGKPVLYGALNKVKNVILKEWYVEATENFIGYPTVRSITVTGLDPESGKDVTEILTP